MQKPISIKIDKFTFINYPDNKMWWFINNTNDGTHIGVNFCLCGEDYKLHYNYIKRTQLELSIITDEVQQFIEKVKLVEAFE